MMLSADVSGLGSQVFTQSSGTPATTYTESAADTLTIVTDNVVTTSINESKRLIAFLNIFFSSLNDNASISIFII